MLHAEPGAREAAKFIGDAAISAVNVAEVAGKLAERGSARLDIRSALEALMLDVVEFDELLAIEAGVLRATTRHVGVSLGDRACLATAIRLGLPVVTADRAWATLDLPIEVILIR